MTRRPNPERIIAARRAAVIYGLLGTGMDEETATLVDPNSGRPPRS